jgi:NAD(P)-dependent dehydrogenase (short-subunit alcohol dehydrogenase family)
MENNRDMFSLDKKTAIVTGGSGILGREFCRTLAQNGAKVILIDKTYEQAALAVNDLLALDNNLEIIPLGCDVTNADEVTKVVDVAVDLFGSIDILHNNAATKTAELSDFFEPFETYKLETWREVMSVNLDGMFLMAQAVGRQMLKQTTNSSIIQTSSIYGVVAPDQRIYTGSKYLGMEINTPAVYTASKSAVIGLTRYLAAYWGNSKIRVNSLSPGGIESGQNSTFKELYSNRVPLGRMGRVDELSSALLYLASDASSYVTGQNLVVDGGLTCW